MLFDSSAWIEFFQGTENSKIIENILQSEDNFKSEVTFAEVVNWCLKNKIAHRIPEYIEGIKKGSRILFLSESIIISAGKINYERKKTIHN